MKKHLLLLSTMLVFLVGFRSSGNYLYSHKSSILSGDPLLKIDDPLLVPGQASSFGGVSRYCQEVGIATILYQGNDHYNIIFYNLAHRKYLTRSGVSPSYNEKIKVFVDDNYIGIITKLQQSWYFIFLGAEESEYGGWPFKLDTWILAPGRAYVDAHPRYPMEYNADLVTLPDYHHNRPEAAGRFEFIITKSKNNCRQPIGLIVHKASKRLVMVNNNQVILGEVYYPNKINNYGDAYFWESRLK